MHAPSTIVLVLGVAGCQLAFDVDVPDAPAVACPALGVPLTFASPTSQLVDARNCRMYTRSVAADLAVAVCGDFDLFEGAIDQPLVKSTFTRRRQRLGSAAIDLGGAELFTVEYDDDSTRTFNPPTLEAYTRSGISWSSVGGSPLAFDRPVAGTPSNDGRIIVNDPNSMTLVELQRTGPAAWTEVATTPYAELGELTPAERPIHLTPDGRRVTFAARAPVTSFFSRFGYAERTSVEDPFSGFVASEVEASELFLDANMSDGCNRLYFAQGTGVFFTARE